MKEVSSSVSIQQSYPPTPSTTEVGDEKVEVEGGLSAGDSWAYESSIPTSPSNGFIWTPAVDGSFVQTSTSQLRTDGSASSPIVRPLIIGSLVGALAACIYQVYVFKLVYPSVSSPFLVLLIYVLGVAWAWVLPCSGAFGVNEHAMASIIAISAARGNLAVQTFAVQKLYYGTEVDLLVAFLGIFATAGFGCGVAGLLDSIAATSSKYIFPNMLPALSLLTDLHRPTRLCVPKPSRQFGIAFAGAFIYEILPAYIFPLLTGISAFCLSSRRATQNVRQTFTNIFGGAGGNEGLGLLSLSFDWQYIGAACLTQPISYQVNTWAGYMICYAAVTAIYYSNLWNSRILPIISTAMFDPHGQVFDQSGALDDRFTVDYGLLKIAGLPGLTSASIWTSVASNLAFGSLIAHALLFIGVEALWPFRARAKGSHGSANTAQSSSNTPGWWYTVLIFLSFFSGITVVLRQHLHSQVSFLGALLVGTIAIPTSTALYGHLGVEFSFLHVSKMVGAAIFPGRPLAILYFAMWSNSAVSTSAYATSQMKFGNQLKLPSRVTFCCILWGLILGGLVNFLVMIPIVKNERVKFVSALGLNIWSGQLTQIMNSEAVTWSLAKELYSIRGRYAIIPFGPPIGFAVTSIQYALHKALPNTTIFNGNVVMLPVVLVASSMMTYGNTSSVLSTVIVAVVCRCWLMKKYKKGSEASLLSLGGALDGGSQLMILLLSFTVLGGMSAYKPFLKWFGNPLEGNVDYCNAS